MALTKTDKTFIKSLIKPLDKRVGSLENKTDNLTKQHLLLFNRVERGFKEATENLAKLRNENLNGFDQVLTEIRKMRQENRVPRHKT